LVIETTIIAKRERSGMSRIVKESCYEVEERERKDLGTGT
jgi:hypothetical protein